MLISGKQVLGYCLTFSTDSRKLCLLAETSQDPSVTIIQVEIGEKIQSKGSILNRRRLDRGAIKQDT